MRLPRILAISALVILAPTAPAFAAPWFMAIPLEIVGTEQSVEAVYSQPPRSCGLGSGLPLLLPALMWLQLRRSSRG